MEIRTDKANYEAGQPLAATVGLVSRKEGIQGWSYGVEHDPAVLEIKSVTIEGTNTAELYDNGFNQTKMIEDAGAGTGFIQAIVLSLMNPVEVPKSDFFSMAKASYTVKADACKGKQENFKTKIEVSEDLAVPGSPPVELNLTWQGKSTVPGKIVNAEPTITGCEPGPGEGLFLNFDKAETELVADTSTLYEVKVLFEYDASSGSQDVRAWSYGMTLDRTELVPVSGMPGADSQALKGGEGPDFANYNLDEQDAGGTLRGVTVGVVLDVEAPGTTLLVLPANDAKHIDTIKVRSVKEIACGGASKSTVIRFSDKLGAPVIDVLATAGNGDSITPDFTDTLTLTLKEACIGKPRFIRADSNNDARVDIADGVWIINELFYGKTATACRAAADANNDKKVDLSDALYIFNYELQPAKTPGNLFPRPPDPFPNCGSVDDVDFDKCPKGSTTCMP